MVRVDTWHNKQLSIYTVPIVSFDRQRQVMTMMPPSGYTGD